MEQIVGLDIGGANLKIADTNSRSYEESFALWQAPEELPTRLAKLLKPFAGFERIALTMTAELADCFASKAEGVAHVTRSVQQVATGRPVSVWQTGGEFVDANVAADIPLLVAAANWHALATWAGRLVTDENALLIDIGSTTTDITPLQQGVPVNRGLTDVERLQNRELLYTGVRRTPVFAVSDSVEFRGGHCSLAAELFATMQDVYLLTGDLPEEEQNCDTADSRPATRVFAHNRIAHSICCDRNECSLDEAVSIAAQLAESQQYNIAFAAERVASRLDPQVKKVIVAGSGAFLAESIQKSIQQQPDSYWSGRNRQRILVWKSADLHLLQDDFGTRNAAAACAYAVAHLLAENG